MKIITQTDKRIILDLSTGEFENIKTALEYDVEELKGRSDCSVYLSEIKAILEVMDEVKL